MASSAIVIDISSDEEDEVTLLDVKRKKPKKELDDDDDDCLILDGDPDKPLDVKNIGSDDDLLVTGEKGQIACRDFPHSRHLCASFPFNSTSHEKYCIMCHCYVCDSVAPCLYWGNGESVMDHCHANEKVDVWRIQRRNFKAEMTVSSVPIRSSPSLHIPGVNPSSVKLSQHCPRSLPPALGGQQIKRPCAPGARSLVQSQLQFKRAGTAGSGTVPPNSKRPPYQYYQYNDAKRSKQP